MDDQLDEVMMAILDGKYSWACVLWLEARGYNPKDYIPCRTYNRLMRQQKQNSRKNASSFAHDGDSRIMDLSYLDDTHSDNRSVQGGYSPLGARSDYRHFLYRY